MMKLEFGLINTTTLYIRKNWNVYTNKEDTKSFSIFNEITILDPLKVANFVALSCKTFEL